MVTETKAEHKLVLDSELRQRASRVIPGGMFGHQNAGRLPEGYPQFMERGLGCHVWDADGNEYIDFMCSYGPIVLGHRHPGVEAAVQAQLAAGDCGNGPSARLVELAETLVDLTPAADWALFAKNGTDATTWCVSIARQATGKRKVLLAQGAYHGAAPWCRPFAGGVTAEDRAHQLYFTYNDLASLEQAACEAEGDLAGVMVSPFRHDAGHDQELVDPEFARGVRALCDRTGAALMLDDVRCGFRFDIGGSWEPIGVRPDLIAYSKAIANGYALAAILGTDSLREGARGVYNTGSFWFSAASMTASLATLRALQDEDAFREIERAGSLLRKGLAAQAESLGLRIKQTGPVQMPFLSFEDDARFEKANLFTSEAAKRGVYLHPWHNWFLSAAHTDEDIRAALERTDEAFTAVKKLVTD